MAMTIKEELTSREAVNRLLRCRKTQRYFDGEKWTSEVSRAKTYGDEIEAVRACVHHGLTNVELVLRTPGGDSELFCTPIR
jgi:hypothetical protein